MRKRLPFFVHGFGKLEKQRLKEEKKRLEAERELQDAAENAGSP